MGGMSTVVLAFDQRLERHVAVKLLAEQFAHDQRRRRLCFPEADGLLADEVNGIS